MTARPKSRQAPRRRSNTKTNTRRNKRQPGPAAGRVILLNKPYDVLCKFSDAEGRATLADFVPVGGVYPAGRLDKDSEGLVLLTGDGELAHRISHPAYKLSKVYLAQVEGVPDEAALAALRRGVTIPDKRKGRAVVPAQTAPARVELLDAEPDLWPRSKPVRPYGEKRWLRLVIGEGKKRQVRHMTAAVGYPTLRLIRVAIGPLTLDDLQPGRWRELTPVELADLRRLLGLRNLPSGRRSS